jgi:hypothetical protein
MVIHRFNTFLGMRALCDRSEVSYLSRGRRTKRHFNRAKKETWEQITQSQSQMASAILNLESSYTIHCTHHTVTTPTLSMFFMAVSLHPTIDQHIDSRKVFKCQHAFEHADKIGKMLSEATGRSRPRAEVHGVICPDLIEYSVIPASPQSAAAAGLNVFSDIRNCLGR